MGNSRCVWAAYGACDSDWDFYGGYCYYLSKAEDSVSSWHQSRDFCNDNGANLISIHDDEEMEFIKTLAENKDYTGSVWIGYSRVHDRTNYVWSDQTPKDYEAWAEDQPSDGSTAQELCAFTLTKQKDNCYTRDQKIDTVMGLLDRPLDADGVDTFSFFYSYTDDVERCERDCGGEARCRSYTYILNSEPNYVWKGECLGRSDTNPYSASYEHAVSGSKITCDETGLWYSANCAQPLGYICKKQEGQQSPVTDVPTLPVEGFCKEGWFDVGNKCYRMVTLTFNTGIEWSEAVEECRNGEGPLSDIASFNTAQEMAAISSRMTSLTFGYWVGLTKIAGEPETWGWTDNTRNDVTNWGPDQPSYSGDCVEVNYNPGPIGTWYNKGCTEKKGYICQYIKDYDAVVGTPASTPSSSCAPGYTSYKNSCFRLMDAVSVTWSQARDSCSQGSADLASIHDASENAYAFLAAKGQPVWLGLSKVSNDEWLWSDGWPTQYTNWGSDPGSEDGCVVLNTDRTWMNVPCSTSTYAYLCKTTMDIIPTTPSNIPGSCPEDWEEFGGHCYWFESTSSLAWEDAEQSCQELAGNTHNGHLAAVHTEAENDYIYNHYKNTDYLYLDVWVGLRRDGIGNHFRWSDNSALQYIIWAPGEPNGAGDETVCVEMYIGHWPGYWNDHFCNQYRHYVCKAEKGPPPTTPPSPAPGIGSCPDATWRQWGEYCYWTDPDMTLTWERAQTECVKRGGPSARLASMTGNDDNWLVQDMVRQNPTDVWGAWIGMIKDAIPENLNFRWSDGTNVSFTKWATGEPNDQTGRENCVEIYRHTGEWNDHDCRHERDFICKVKKVIPSNPTTPVYPALQPEPDYSGLSDGMTAGIIIGIMAAFVVLIAVAGLLFRYFTATDNAFGRMSGFNVGGSAGGQTSDLPYNNMQKDGGDGRVGNGDRHPQISWQHEANEAEA